jgi:hypothetical protein
MAAVLTMASQDPFEGRFLCSAASVESHRIEGEPARLQSAGAGVYETEGERPPTRRLRNAPGRGAVLGAPVCRLLQPLATQEL